MMRRTANLLLCFVIVLLSSEVSAQSRDSERERLARTIEQLVKTYGNPLDRSRIEYFGVSIDPKTGNVSQLYEDVEMRERNGHLFKVNHLFNLKVVDAASIEVHSGSRWWTIQLRALKGEVIPVHSEHWNHDSQKNEDSWWKNDRIDEFCGTETEGKAREIADYLRSLVKLYQ